MRERFVVALAALCLGASTAAQGEPSLRVRVLEQVSSVVLSGRALEVQDRPVRGGSVRATLEAGQLRVADLATRGPVRVRGEDGVSVDGRRFPGRLTLVPREDGGMDVVNVVPLEAYVERSVTSETYAEWPAEALKAQAVVTRTYALHEHARRRGRDYDLEANVLSQRYAAGTVPSTVRRAVAATQGEFLAYGGEPILAAFHASAGGRTADAREVWGLHLPYLLTVSSPDTEAPDHFWSFDITFTDLAQALNEAGISVGSGRSIEISGRSPSGRVSELTVGQARLTGRDLRKVLGGRAIRSTLFEVRREGETLRFLGSGSGHGVGLSQWGARELARQGESYPRILAHYYPETRLARIREGSGPL